MYKRGYCPVKADEKDDSHPHGAIDL